MLRFLICACLWLVSCAAPLQLPPAFLVLYDEVGDHRAVTGDDARVWYRRFEGNHDAGREFWRTAVEYEFLQQRGYELVGQGVVRDSDGNEGDWLECIANVEGDRVGYLVAFWVVGETIHVVEFGARSAVYATHIEEVRAALATFRG
jgi:hypothetical protein